MTATLFADALACDADVTHVATGDRHTQENLREQSSAGQESFQPPLIPHTHPVHHSLSAHLRSRHDAKSQPFLRVDDISYKRTLYMCSCIACMSSLPNLLIYFHSIRTLHHNWELEIDFCHCLSSRLFVIAAGSERWTSNCAGGK